MKLRLDHLRLRLMGVLFGLSCLGLGLSGVIGEEGAASADFAIIAIVTGLIATVGSLLTTDIIGFWYCNPKRLAARRAVEERPSNLSTGS
ncbi:MAG: hypothetical protein OEU92_19315 [Alphaproteobacteria bacterium]|nr:hypothetical protein [Alphaproteobacteria bacterium]